MKSVSFILDASKATKTEIETLSQDAATLQDAGVQCEYVLYDANVTSDSHFVSVATSAIPGVSSFRKAIASSSGERLVFTTISNVIADRDYAVVHQAAGLSDIQLAVPHSSANRKPLSGRVLRAAPYVITSKPFAVKHLHDPSTLATTIKTANRLHIASYVPVVAQALPDVLVARLVLPRPYAQIARNVYRAQTQRIKTEFKQRRELRLSRRVPTVPFDKAMPVFIICRDRVEPLKKLVAWLEAEGMTNIFLIDNDSTYPPLVKYLQSSKHEVIYLRANVGHTSPWVSGAVGVYAAGKSYIVTDPDVIPTDDSHGAIERFCELLTKYPERRKAGFGLKIDDLPDHYALKQHVISWEKQFWVTEKEPEVYDAEIDTTFAVYRQDAGYVFGPGLRTGGRFVARHEPWYIDSDNLSEEVRYYREHADKAVGSWGTSDTDLSDTYRSNTYRSKS